ncbi:hypothetical protein F4805DRAFT_416216 [Annulohypoxylon moriforme]|nr:hypothetical protein F4805DRAFT_416216 [Annulohypoxylon moriforme]
MEMNDAEHIALRAEQPRAYGNTFNALSLKLSSIHAELKSDFSQFQREGFQTKPTFFLHMYSTLTTTLHDISLELRKEDAVRETDLFNQGVEILEGYRAFVTQNIGELGLQRNFHDKLWIHVSDLSKFQFTSFNNTIGVHIRGMIMLAASITPQIEQVWSDGDLPNHNRFQTAFEEFRKLGAASVRDDADIRDVVLRSKELLGEALLGLRIPLAATHLQPELSSDDTRPTYIDFPCTSDEYRFGKGTRPGVLDLKLKLGGSITPEETEKLKQAKEVSKKRPAPPDAEEPPSPKKIPSPSPPPKEEKPPSPKEPIPARGYSMTLENVDADIGDIYLDAGLNVAGWEYEEDDVLTQTVPNQKETLASYRIELGKVLRRLRRDYYRPEEPPLRQAEQEALIDRIPHDIVAERDYINERKHATTSFGKIKDAKIRSYGLRYLRCLHMRLLLSSDRPVPKAQLEQALIDRLDDWILFEEIWNVGDLKSQRQPRISISKKSSYLSFVDQRMQNINSWKELQRQLREDPDVEPYGDGHGDGGEIRSGLRGGGIDDTEDGAADGAAIGVGGDTLAGVGVEIGNGEGEGIEEEREQGPRQEEGQVEGQAEEKEDAVMDDIDDLFGDPGEGKVEDGLEKVATEEPVEKQQNSDEPVADADNAQPFPDTQTEPLNERVEQQQAEIKTEAATDKTSDEHSEVQYDEGLKERFRRDIEIISGVVDSMAAGGPPDHDQIPTTTVFEKLTYMIVLTHWRFFQARDIIQLGVSYPL